MCVLQYLPIFLYLFLNFGLLSGFLQLTATGATGHRGKSVAEHAVKVKGQGHANVTTRLSCMTGSRAREAQQRASSVTSKPVQVSQELELGLAKFSGCF